MTTPVNPKRLAGIEIRIVGDEVLVHHSAANKVHVLNASAGEILELCDGSHDLPGLVAAMRGRHADAPAALDADVAHMLEQFTTLGLLETR